MEYWAKIGLSIFWNIFYLRRVILKPIGHYIPNARNLNIEHTNIKYINPIQVNVLFLWHLTIWDNLWFFEVFRGYKKETLAWNMLTFYCFYHCFRTCIWTCACWVIYKNQSKLWKDFMGAKLNFTVLNCFPFYHIETELIMKRVLVLNLTNIQSFNKSNPIKLHMNI